MFWKPTVALEADVATFLVELSEAADGIVQWDPDWIPTLRKRDQEKESATEKVTGNSYRLLYYCLTIVTFRWPPKPLRLT